MAEKPDKPVFKPVSNPFAGMGKFARKTRAHAQKGGKKANAWKGYTGNA